MREMEDNNYSGSNQLIRVQNWTRALPVLGDLKWIQYKFTPWIMQHKAQLPLQNQHQFNKLQN